LARDAEKRGLARAVTPGEDSAFADGDFEGDAPGERIARHNAYRCPRSGDRLAIVLIGATINFCRRDSAESARRDARGVFSLRRKLWGFLANPKSGPGEPGPYKSRNLKSTG